MEAPAAIARSTHRPTALCTPQWRHASRTEPSFGPKPLRPQLPHGFRRGSSTQFGRQCCSHQCLPVPAMSYTAQGGGTSMTCPVPASALVLLHDGKLSCNSLKAEAPLLGRPPPCLVQPAPLNGSAADCRLGDRRLKSGTLYLFSIAPAAARRLERIRSLFFSRLEAARQLYGLRLGMGTWYRLVADHLLLPSGIRAWLRAVSPAFLFSARAENRHPPSTLS